jgi:RNA polymerase primary sigma factor
MLSGSALAAACGLRHDPAMAVGRRRVLSSDEAQLLGRYIRDISRFPRLTPEEEKELGRLIRQGDQQALQRLVESNLRFVVSYAKRYRNLGLPFLDLIHEGNLGLIEAARRFDPERNVKFISYAVWWIRQSIMQSLSEHTRAFSVPARLAGVFGRLEREFSAGDAEGTPAPEEVAATLDLSVDEVNALLAISGDDVSLSEPLGEDGELSDRLEEEVVPPADLKLIREAFLAQVQELLKELSQKEAEVLRLRFGLDGSGEPLTLQEIGDRLQLSRERVRQIESKAMAKLRRSGQAQALRGFLN